MTATVYPSRPRVRQLLAELKPLGPIGENLQRRQTALAEATKAEATARAARDNVATTVAATWAAGDRSRSFEKMLAKARAEAVREHDAACATLAAAQADAGDVENLLFTHRQKVAQLSRDLQAAVRDSILEIVAHDAERFAQALADARRHFVRIAGAHEFFRRQATPDDRSSYAQLAGLDKLVTTDREVDFIKPADAFAAADAWQQTAGRLLSGQDV